jgi:hypothetical protein
MKHLVLLACLAGGCGKLLGIDELSGPTGPGGDGAVTDGTAGFCNSHGIDACDLAIGGALSLADGVIDTANNATCQSAPGVLACVLYADTVTVAAGVQVSLVGPKPVVVFARRTIAIDGLLDASSYIAQIPSQVRHGAGSTGLRCASGLTTRGPGSPGGSFGGKGGRGGDSSVLPEASQPPPTMPRGGCPGGDASSGARPSPPGGGLWLIAGESITIGPNGTVAANGAGGAGGDAAGLGGFGGGSGGYLLLAAARVSNRGVLAANGGGGGGGGKTGAGGGGPGTDGTATMTRSAGGPGVAPGGNGGRGAAGADLDGENGATAGDSSQAGGGGGGGGAGIISIDAADLTLPGLTSPAPSVPLP